MMKMARDHPSLSEWIISNLPPNSQIGFDPYLVSASSASSRISSYQAKGFQFIPYELNLVNQVWKNRPSISQDPVYIHELQYAGKTVSEKLDLVQACFSQKFYFTSTLDDIAWLLNLRGSDIEYNPLFISYLLIDRTHEPSQMVLFINRNKVAGISEYLESVNVKVEDYENVGKVLSQIEDSVVVDQDEINFGLIQKIKKPVNVPNVIARIKAVKSEREIRGFVESHQRDAVAMVKYFCWLEKALKAGEKLNEWTAASRLDQLRAEQPLNKGLSFENISSSGPNAAIIHYAATADKARDLNLDEIYLLDSGGQYLDGTIDTTRTLHFGTPTDWEKECFTRVLLGNLDLERVKWPQSARLTGNDFDVIPRRWLWQKGLDYNHATGHGVGYFLNVHEGPHYLCKGGDEEFKLNMNITNEPGYYEEGKFGIRIENVLLIQKSSNLEDFLEFFNVTLVPYDKNLMDFSLIDRDTLDYINHYHNRILNTIGPMLLENNESEAYEWLIRATSPIVVNN